jgi:uncharacterized membrane protein
MKKNNESKEAQPASSQPQQSDEQQFDDEPVGQVVEIIPAEIVIPSDPISGRSATRSIAIIQTTLRAHTGPLPSPESLASYERAIPGSGERILAMGEREQQHRHKQESRLVWADIGLQYLGLLSAVAIAFLGIWLGSNLIQSGHEKGGIALIVTALAGIIASIVGAIRAVRTDRAGITPESEPKTQPDLTRRQAEAGKSGDAGTSSTANK